MNPWTALHYYSGAAADAPTPTWRTVYMIGMQCATAVSAGDLVAFVGTGGKGADWPDPRIFSKRWEDPI
jgi:hypothetical protein